MPLEIRRHIYRAFLVKNASVKLQCDYQPDAIRWTSSLSVNEGVTALLRTCRKINTEGTEVLYGDNTFECYHVRVFKNEFIRGRSYKGSDVFRGIGTENATKIKRGIFGLPLVIIRNPQDSPECNPFLDFLCTDLVELQKLTLKTDTICDSGLEARTQQMVRTRALVTTAARIAKYHPSLRKSIWRHLSGNERSRFGDCLLGDWYVDLVAPGFEIHLNHTTTKLDADGQEFKAVDVLLNNAMILHTSWLQKQVWDSVANFALDKSQLTRNVDKSEIALWPGEREYEPLLELEFPDKVALAELSHGRFIRCIHTPGRFIDGKFIKGWWFDGLSRFVQGEWLQSRFIEGKQHYGEFVEGEWINDTKFVEGKWVDGRLIKGVWVDYINGEFLEGAWRDGIFVKGKWIGDEFTEGKSVGKLFYSGKWASNGAFAQGCWATQPKIADLAPLEGWWSKLGKKDNTEVDDAEGYENEGYDTEDYDID